MPGVILNTRYILAHLILGRRYCFRVRKVRYKKEELIAYSEKTSNKAEN